jgi:hypothetical protein
LESVTKVGYTKDLNKRFTPLKKWAEQHFSEADDYPRYLIGGLTKPQAVYIEARFHDLYTSLNYGPWEGTKEWFVVPDTVLETTIDELAKKIGKKYVTLNMDSGVYRAKNRDIIGSVDSQTFGANVVLSGGKNMKTVKAYGILMSITDLCYHSKCGLCEIPLKRRYDIIKTRINDGWHPEWACEGKFRARRSDDPDERTLDGNPSEMKPKLDNLHKMSSSAIEKISQVYAKMSQGKKLLEEAQAAQKKMAQGKKLLEEAQAELEIIC